MRQRLNVHPRVFNPIADLLLKDMGALVLEEDEQITIETETGLRNDILRKSWGFYLGNSLNVNLKRQGLRTALVKSMASGDPRLYINLVEKAHSKEFMAYLRKYDAQLVCWLDEWPLGLRKMGAGPGRRGGAGRRTAPKRGSRKAED